MIPNWPRPPSAPKYNSGFSVSEQVHISPLPVTMSNSVTFDDCGP
uniref:Uncharacterized protein n=1 Tax=Rhizophora mucronata TaxID=61149 RepID=A0A2P2IIW9_RHIMU